MYYLECATILVLMANAAGRQKHTKAEAVPPISWKNQY